MAASRALAASHRRSHLAIGSATMTPRKGGKCRRSCPTAPGQCMIGSMHTRLLAGIAGSLMAGLLVAQAPGKKITRAADVPQFQYSIQGNVEDLVQSEEAFRPFAAEVRKNVE